MWGFGWNVQETVAAAREDSECMIRGCDLRGVFSPFTGQANHAATILWLMHNGLVLTLFCTIGQTTHWTSFHKHNKVECNMPCNKKLTEKLCLQDAKGKTEGRPWESRTFISECWYEYLQRSRCYVLTS